MIRTTQKPNRMPFLTAMLVLLACGQYATRAHAGDRTAMQGVVSIDCQHRYLSQREAGRLLGIDNFSQTYARRARLYADIARACAAGVAVVRVGTATRTGTSLSTPARN